MQNRFSTRHKTRERRVRLAEMLRPRSIGPLRTDEGSAVTEALQTLRRLLDMDVAYVSEFLGDHRIFRHVDCKESDASIQAGGTAPIDTDHCNSIARGDMSGLIPHTDAQGRSQDTVPVRGMRVGAHLGVPLRLADGRLFGTLCCFNHVADPSLNDRDLRLVRMFGNLIAGLLDVEASELRMHDPKSRRIREALREGEPNIVYQPVFRLRDGVLLGAEALARFSHAPLRSPEQWFAEANSVGFKTALELQAIRNAVEAFRPAWRQACDLRLAVNASPETILSAGLQALLEDIPVDRMALEITEHEHVGDYPKLTAVLGALRGRGCKITVDDAGSGYASLRHILQIEPEVIKLDLSLVRGIDGSVGKRALAGGLVEFAKQTGCVLIAEGVETEAELAVLHAMHVNSGQGYLLGRPASIDALCRRIEEGARADTTLPPPSRLAAT